MHNRLVRLSITVLLIAASASCSGSSNSDIQPRRKDLIPVLSQHGLPGLADLAAGVGTPLRGASSSTIDLLSAGPILTSGGGSAAFGGGSLTLDPAQNSGLAWAIFELYDFPSNHSVRPEQVSVGADAPCYLGVSNFTQQVWNHTLLPDSSPLVLGDGYIYENGQGSMYLAVLATSGSLQVSALSVQVSGALENAGYNEREDNDTVAKAQQLPLLPLAGFKGSLGPGGYDGDNSDYYKFSAAEGAVLNLSLTYPAAACNISLTLYKPGGSSPLVNDSSGNPGARSIIIGLKAGVYAFRANALSGAGDYTLDASLAPSGLTELEDNDSSSAANVLGASLSASGSVGPASYDGDLTDYFSTQAGEGDFITLTLTYSAGQGNLNLILHNAAGVTLYTDSAGNPGLRSFSWGVHAGTVYAEVRAASGGSQYTLDCTVAPSGAEEIEDNDSFTAPQLLPAPPLLQFSGSAGLFSYDGDSSDYYSFNCVDGDIVSAGLAYDNAQGNLSFTLYNSDHSQVQKDSSGNAGTRGLNWGVHGGLCYLLVKAENGHSDYDLDLALSHPGYGETENNDATATANVLGSFPVSGLLGSVGANGYDGDTADYYTFTAADKEQFSFGLGYDELSGNVGLVLSNALNQPVFSDTAGNPGSRNFDWCLKAGSYYLKVLSASGSSDYSLDISKTLKAYDETEDNDSRPAAQNLTLPAVAFKGHCGTFGYDGDNNDYYIFSFAAPVTCNASMSYTAANGTLKLTLLDINGSTVASDTAGNPGTRTISQAVAAGTYYLWVQCSAGGSEYQLSASGAP